MTDQRRRSSHLLELGETPSSSSTKFKKHGLTMLKLQGRRPDATLSFGRSMRSEVAWSGASTSAGKQHVRASKTVCTERNLCLSVETKVPVLPVQGTHRGECMSEEQHEHLERRRHGIGVRLSMAVEAALQGGGRGKASTLIGLSSHEDQQHRAHASIGLLPKPRRA